MTDHQDNEPHYPYPQPSNGIPTDISNHPNFYTYDETLPFSPCKRSSQGQDIILTDYSNPNPDPDPENTENSTPNTATYPIPSRPMSARWTNHHSLLPPSEMVFDRFQLPFDEGGLFLQDFEAALAQVDESSAVW